MVQQNKKKGRYTWKDVAKHNKPDDAWISIQSKVYDVTKWMDSHPGGREVLNVTAGRDCSILFNTYHPLKTHEILHKFEIGDLVDSELPQFAKDKQTTFYPTVKRELQKYFKDSNQNSKSNAWIWLRYFCIIATVLTCSYVWFTYRHLGVLFGCAVSLVQGFACALIGLMPLHDGSHFSITHKPWVWQLCMLSHDFLNGASSLVWTYQHVLGHHPYTNVEGADPDIDTTEHDIRRIKTSQPWYSHYLSQHIYTPLVYCFLAWKTRYQDVAILHFSQTNGAIRVNPPTTRQLAFFWGGKLTWFTYRILIPSMFMPVWQVLLYLTIADFVTSYWLALTFQANHVVHEVKWLKANEQNKIDADWAVAQLETTQDYEHNSRFWTLSTGALNYQSTHHLVPGIHQFYYPQVAPIIQKIAKQHKVKYLHKETFAEALGSHIGFLHHMGHFDSNGKPFTEKKKSN